MSSRTWEGQAELHEALQGLACAKGTSATKIKAVASAAFKYVKDYKRVVHDVEMFLWKADVEHRLAGLYAVDSIIRQSQLKFGAKDQFAKRFGLHLTNTINAIKNIPADAQQHVLHVVQEWQTREFYTVLEIEKAGGQCYSINATNSDLLFRDEPPQHDEPVAPVASTGKLASLLSLLKKQKDRNDQQHPITVAAPTPTTTAHGNNNNAAPFASGLHNALPPSLLGPPPRAARIDGAPPPSLLGPPPQQQQQHARMRSPPRAGGLLPPPLQQQQQRAPSMMMPPGANDYACHNAYDDRMRTRDDDRSWYDDDNNAREAKKPRSSRWGPPKPMDDDDHYYNRPTRFTGGTNALMARDDRSRSPPRNSFGRSRSSRSRSRSPPSRGGYADRRFEAGPVGGRDDWRDRDGPPMRSNGWSSSSYDRDERGRDDRWRDDQGRDERGRGPMAPSFDSMRQQPPPFSGGGARNQSSNYGGNASSRYDDNRTSVSPRRFGATSSNNSSSNKSKRPVAKVKSKELCHKFMTGLCPYGDNCWHSHDKDALQRLQTAGDKERRSSSGGGSGSVASSSSDAMRSHSSPHTARGSSGRYDDNRERASSPRRYDAGPGASSGGGSSTIRHAEAPNTNADELCRKFMRGHCPYGEKCWNVHDPEARDKQKQQAQEGGPTPMQNQTTKVCKDFAYLGKCSYGDRCRFEHHSKSLMEGPASSSMHQNERPSAAADSGSNVSMQSAAPAFDNDRQSAPSPTSTMAPVAPVQQQQQLSSGTGVLPLPPHQYQAVYNELQGGDRGISGAYSLSHNHHHYEGAAAPVPVVVASRPRFQPRPFAYPPNMITHASGVSATPTAQERTDGSGAPSPAQGGAANNTFTPRAGPTPEMLQPSMPGAFPPRGFAGMVPPPRPLYPGTPTMMGPPPPRPLAPGMTGPPPPGLMGPPPPRTAPGYPPQAPPMALQQPPVRHPVPTTTTPETQLGANSVGVPTPAAVTTKDDDDEDEAPVFTLQYDDED